ncbi:MAG: hypothetical protein J6S45_05880, partial [Firmicutes bacterium]|nr:hypothetical protein [Bacillota bacterium]
EAHISGKFTSNAEPDRRGETMTEQKTILCIGDSIVEGYPYGLEDSWVACAEQRWIQQHNNENDGRDDLWINAGISGQTTAEIRSRMGYGLLRWKPDLVILSCGTNDFIFLEGAAGEPDSAWENIRAMANAVLCCGVKVIIAAPPLTIPQLASRRWSDGTDYAEVNRKLKELRQRIEHWCKEGAAEAAQENIPVQVMMWDVQQLLDQNVKREGDTPEAASRWFVDGLHPTTLGYETMAKQLCELLNENSSFL